MNNIMKKSNFKILRLRLKCLSLSNIMEGKHTEGVATWNTLIIQKSNNVCVCVCVWHTCMCECVCVCVCAHAHTHVCLHEYDNIHSSVAFCDYCAKTYVKTTLSATS